MAEHAVGRGDGGRGPAARAARERAPGDRRASTVHGPAAFEGRAPTTIFNVDGRDPAHVAHELAERKIAVWSGDNYACELIDALGLRERGGAVRAGVVRYTTTDDIDALLAAIQDLA